MASEKVKTFTDADFGDEVKNGVVLVDFWAEWCAPCRRLAPTVDQLAEEYNGRLTVAKVDIDENPMTPSKFMIRGIPTLLLFKDGDLKETVVGLATKDVSRRSSTSTCEQPPPENTERGRSSSSAPARPDSPPRSTRRAPISSRWSSKASKPAAS